NGTRGDIHPLLALAAGLARRGHEVVFCGPPDFADEARAEGVELRPVGTSVRAYLAERPALLHGGALASLRAGQRYVEEQLEPQLRDLARAIDRADWVLAGGAQFTASSVAELREARFRMIAYCPSLLRSRWQTPFAVPRAELPPWANRVAWRWLERFVDRTVGRVLGRARAALGLPRPRDLLRAVFGERPALAAEPILAPVPRSRGRGRRARLPAPLRG